MIIILKDFNYKGEHIDEAEFDWPNVHSIDDIPEGKGRELILDTLAKCCLEEG